MEELKEKLISKLDKEYKSFVNDLKSQGVEKVIDNAYELVVKQEICDYMQFSNLEENEVKAILKHDAFLDDIYDEWLGADFNLYESLEYVISERVGDITRKLENKMKIKDIER